MKFQRVVLKLTKGVNDIAVFPISLSRQIYNASSVEIELAHFTGVANAGGDPTTKMVSIDFGLPHGTYETITNSESTQSWYVPISAAPNALISYDQPETRMLNAFNVHSGSQIRHLTVKVYDETNAATRTAPQFTGMNIILRFNLRDDDPPVRHMMRAEINNSSVYKEAPSASARRGGYRFY